MLPLPLDMAPGLMIHMLRTPSISNCGQCSLTFSNKATQSSTNSGVTSLRSQPSLKTQHHNPVSQPTLKHNITSLTENTTSHPSLKTQHHILH